MTAPLRSLLITFDQLAPEELQTSSGTVTLSQHYRQLDGWRSIADFQQQDTGPHSKLDLVVVANEQQGELAADFPDHFTTWSSQNLMQKLQQVLQSTACETSTLWIHIANGKQYLADQVLAVIKTCRQYAATDLLMAVTAFGMHLDQPPHSFDVLADDDLMRVPAIFEHKGFSEFYLQSVTSSHDLLHTLLLHACQQSTDFTHHQEKQIVAEQQHWDLRQLAMQPGITVERNLAFQFDRFKAVRSHNFLYVAEIDRDADNRTPVNEGLYLKPQDRWNVHNVCSEYIETADLMRKRLGLL